MFVRRDCSYVVCVPDKKAPATSELECCSDLMSDLKIVVRCKTPMFSLPVLCPILWTRWIKGHLSSTLDDTTFAGVFRSGRA